MKGRASKVGLVALLITGPGCQTPVGPSTFESDSLRVVAALEPARVGPGDTATVVTVFKNMTARRFTVSFGMGCPFYLRVIDRGSGDPVPMKGADYLCTAAGTAFEIAAGDSVVRTHPLITEINDVPAPRGEYLARLDFTTSIPNLEAPFTVK